MTRTKALIVLCVVAAAISAAAPAGVVAAKTPPPAGIEPLASASWPTIAAQLAKKIAEDAFAHDYARVWTYLLPSYQQAVSHARWTRCRQAHPIAPPDVKITKVTVAAATELAVDLSLLGTRNVQQIELLVQYRSPGAAGPQLAILYTYWLKQAKTWSAVWPSDEYRAYKAGTCYVTPQGSTLY